MKAKTTCLTFRFEANMCDCGQETMPNKDGYVNCGIFDIQNSGWPICGHCGDDLILVDECEVGVEKTLVIEGVDVKLLELQRKEAREFMEGRRDDSGGLEGILAMLDEWSDNNYFKEQGK